MTRYGIGSSSTEWMLTTFSWRICADMRASRRNRLRAGDVEAISRTLIATIRSSLVSKARSTVPQAPLPTIFRTS